MLKFLLVSVTAPFLMLAAHPSLSTETAAIEVSLVVKESCLVQQSDGLAATQTAPSVSCALGSPYGVQSGAPAASHGQAPRSTNAVTPHLWQVTF